MIEDLKCPVCASPMKQRVNRETGEEFYGCTQFPKCRGTRDSEGLSHAEKYHLRNHDQLGEEDDGDRRTRTRPSWRNFRRW